MTRKGFLFMTSYYDSIKELPEKDQLTLFHAICQYGCEGNEVELEGLAKIIFGLIKPTLSASIKRYDNCVENGKRGGRPVANNQPQRILVMNTDESIAKLKTAPNTHRTAPPS